MTILCEVDEPTAVALTRAVGQRMVPVTSLSAAGVAVTADPGERMVVIGTGVELDDVLLFAQHMRIDHPAVSIVLFRTAFDAATIEASQQVGIQEVLTPSEVDALVARIEHGGGHTPPGEQTQEAPPAAHAHSPRGRLITVFAAKGGSGKTTVATNLATVLNDNGAHSVCLVDLDLEFGDVAVSLQLTPASTLVDAIDLGHLDAINVSGLLTPYRPGFNCVLAPIEPGDAEKIPVRLVSQLLESLLATHEYVVVDTPSQFSEHVLAAMDMTHHFVLLTTPEIPALKNLRLTLDMLDLLAYDPNARLIVFNRADARSGLSAADVESAIRTRIGVRVPSSYDVPASINRGVPLAVSHPKHPVSLAIKEIAGTLTTGGPDHAPPRPEKRGLRLRMRSS